VTSGPLSPTREDLDPEYQPHTEIHRFEMDRCLQMDDQVGLVHASVQLQKAERADQLLEMGEFDDEGSLSLVLLLVSLILPPQVSAGRGEEEEAQTRAVVFVVAVRSADGGIDLLISWAMPLWRRTVVLL
jgi:hypothetical protein